MEIELSGYKLKKLLGHGAMSRVYLAYEKKLKRLVALKILRQSLSDERSTTRRFIKEARIAARLHHSNIISIYDVGKQKDNIYISMEYLKESLADRLKKGSGNLKPKEALKIVKDITKALDYAHKKGFVHRDVKPDNIMFRDDGAVVLVDFGIVKAMHSKTRLTKTGYAVGTPEYMSPEQISSPKIDHRADIYSLGIVLYELLVGKVPFSGHDMISLARKHLDDPVPQLPRKLSDFQPLLDKMLAKKPKNRVQSGEGVIRLIDALQYKINTQSTKITVPTGRNRRKKPFFKTLLKRTMIVLVILLVLFFLVSNLQRIKHNRDTAAWETAQKTDTAQAYQQYIQQFPKGIFNIKANAAMLNIKQAKVQDFQFNTFFKEAEKNYQEKKYIRALQAISSAKLIKQNRAVQTLEENILLRKKEMRDSDFNTYMQKANDYFQRGDLETAQEYIDKAKAIKTTNTLIDLQKKIQQKLESHSR